MARELGEHNGAEGSLEADYQAASDHLNLVQTALRQQEKIERYEADLEELQIRLEEQNEVVAERVPKPPSWKSMNSKASLRITSRRWMYSKRARFSITRRYQRSPALKNFAICRI